jgi:hypothetical protein
METWAENFVWQDIITQGQEIVSTLVLLGKWVPVRLSATEALCLCLYHAHSQALIDEGMRRPVPPERPRSCPSQRAWHQVRDDQGCGTPLPAIQERARRARHLLAEASARRRGLTLAPEDALALGLQLLHLGAWFRILLAETSQSTGEHAEIIRRAHGRIAEATLLGCRAPLR